MDITRMKCFIAVAETGSISGAAAALHMTQPAVSFHVREAEKELNSILAERGKKGISLTAAGEIALKEFREIVRRYEKCKKNISELEKKRRPRLTIGYHGPVNWAGIPQFISDYSALYPDVEIVIVNQQMRELAEYLRIGALDIAFLSTDEVEDEDRESVGAAHLFRERVGVLISNSNPLSQRAALKCRELDGQRIFMNNHPSKGLMNMIARLRKMGFRDEDFVFCNSMEATLALAAAGQGMVALPLSFDPNIPTMSLVIVDEDEGWMDYSLFWNKNSLNAHAQAFINMVKKSSWPYI